MREDMFVASEPQTPELVEVVTLTAGGHEVTEDYVGLMTKIAFTNIAELLAAEGSSSLLVIRVDHETYQPNKRLYYKNQFHTLLAKEMELTHQEQLTLTEISMMYRAFKHGRKDY